MVGVGTADLVVLHLDSVGVPGDPGPASERTIAGIGAALGVGAGRGGAGDVAERVALLRALTTVQDEGLVTDVAPVADETRGVSGYRLTNRGRERAATLRAERGEESMPVAPSGTDRSDRARDRSAIDETDAPAEPPAQVTDDEVEPSAAAPGAGGPSAAAAGELVDRETAIATVKSRLADLRAGTARGVLVTGEHGIGKTALLAAARDRAAARGFRTLRGAAGPLVGAPFGPIRDALDGVDVDLGARLAETAGGSSVSDLDARRETAFEAVRATLASLAADRPLAVFLDGLERADPATVALVRYLAGALDDEPVLLVGALTPGAVRADHPLAPEGGLPPGFTQVPLERFDQAATATYLERVLDEPALPDRFVAAVHDRTGGVPLFLAESVSHMAERGTVDPWAGLYPGDPDSLPVPATLGTTVADRVRALGPGPCELLEWAALVGTKVPLPVLERCAPFDGPVLGRHVDRLVVRGHLRRRDDERVAFRSEARRAAVLDRLEDPDRSRRHERIAAALADVHPEPVRVGATIGRHYRAAGALEKALEWFGAGGETALERDAYETAIHAYERALEVAGALQRTDRSRDLLETIGTLHLLADAAGAAERYLCYATDRTASRERLCAIAAKRARILVDRGAFHTAIAVVDDALLDDGGDTVETPSRAVAAALREQARAHSGLGECRQASALRDRAATMAAAVEDDGSTAGDGGAAGRVSPVPRRDSWELLAASTTSEQVADDRSQEPPPEGHGHRGGRGNATRG